ncbi:HK97-gp10 family putative phage morphogenesis protein [Liquorilactobacillus capillatus]|uniref:Uncharacterized protein n=1 Tax=Liquorilactobacillus capillatus DSM 19910 TaxID=1423731 RepID=A0A0R1MFV5_9LACO|nr:HK97-gp10 family putative phage morphogenesis protein [Liquorilactobacillus capillatus]KRL02520.1 hypothetical protein FC81_GL000688 [Liquorilactobacillus capillatus DSM 19910]
MPSLGEQMQSFFKQTGKLIPNAGQKSEITGAGAKVFAEHLQEVTKEKHYTKHNDVKYGHLADNVVYQKNNIDGEKDGSSTVGFGKKAFVAKWLNDGTKKMKGDHFVDNARRESEEKIFEAQRKKYEELTGGDY